jgi:hypothetical protein
VLLQLVDDIQGELGLRADLLEIGVYQGRTAILFQYLCREGEQLAVCDVFDAPLSDDPENRREHTAFDAGLTRQIFEQHFLQYHPRLPVIHQCRSEELEKRLRGTDFRLLHVDGSHIYRIVQSDLRMARAILARDGVIAVDDYRSEHTPGVAAAIWEAIVGGRLAPVCASPEKLHVCRDQPERYFEPLRERAAAHPALAVEEQEVLGRRLLSVSDARLDGATREAYLATHLAALHREYSDHLEAVRRHNESSEQERAEVAGALAAAERDIASLKDRLVRAELEIEAKSIAGRAGASARRSTSANSAAAGTRAAGS